MTQYARPSSDISNATWTKSTGTVLWDLLNEDPYSDTDYMRATGATNQTCEVKLTSVTDPVSSTGHIVRFRAKATGASSPEKMTVTLYQGATLIATILSAGTITRTTYNEYNYTLTAAQADAITNYADLRIRFATTSFAAGETIDVSWVVFECPNAVYNVTTSSHSYTKGNDTGKASLSAYTISVVSVKSSVSAYIEGSPASAKSNTPVYLHGSMAIGIRGVESNNTGTADGTGDVGITVNVPAGVQNGDVMYFGGHIASSTGTFVTPDGWDVVEGNFKSIGHASSNQCLFRRIANNEPASYTLKWGLVTNTGRGGAAIIALYGVSVSTPEMAEQKDTGSAVAGNSETVPSLTAIGDTLLLCFVGGYTSTMAGYTWTSPLGAIERVDTTSNNSTKSNAAYEISAEYVPTGDTGTRTAIASFSDLFTCGISVLLKPGIEIKISQSSYLCGSDNGLSNVLALTIGSDNTKTSIPVYMYGVELRTSITVYTHGSDSPKTNQAAYLVGSSTEKTFALSYVIGSEDICDSWTSYLCGQNLTLNNISAVLFGQVIEKSNCVAFLEGTLASYETIHPNIDIITNNWVNENLENPLYPSLADLDDNTYAKETTTPSVGDYFEVGLEIPTGLHVSGVYTLTWLPEHSEGRDIVLKCELRQGNIVIASDTQTVVYEGTVCNKILTADEVANITDYTNLRIRITVMELP